MKLKDHLRDKERNLSIWPPLWGLMEVNYGRESPNLRQDQFCAEARIQKIARLRDRDGVRIFVSHPDYLGELVGTTTARTKELADNLLTTAEQFRGKTVEELGEAEVTSELLLI
jgi:hypothetical protein